jgi:hypothetical protein
MSRVSPVPPLNLDLHLVLCDFSNLVDCTTGKSAGFAPLRMRFRDVACVNIAFASAILRLLVKEHRRDDL